MAQIPNLQSTNTLGTDDQTILRQGTIDKRISLELAGTLSWAKRNGYIHLGEHITGLVFPDSKSFTTYQGKVYFVVKGVNLPYTALSSDPSSDGNLTPEAAVTKDNISDYAPIVYRASGGNPPVSNMITNAEVGEFCKCENGTSFKRVSNTNGDISDFEASSYLVISDFGAVELTERTVESQSAIDAGSVLGKPVIVDKEYLIDPTRSTVGNDGGTVHIHGLITRPNTHLIFMPSGKLTSIATNVERYCVLLLESEGFVIDNLVIEGDRDIHIGTTGEWGYGLRVDFKGGNGVVNNPKITKCWGDSFVVVTDVGGVTFNNPYGAYSRRQGMSIIRGKGIVVNNYHFEHISGTNPQSGIDFEPDTANEQLEVTLNSGRCNDNAGYDLDFFFSRQVIGSPAHNITFTGIHRMEQWIRLNSVANVEVQNVISFDQLEIGTPALGGTIVLESANSGDCLNIKDLKMNTPPFFRLTPRAETSVTDIGRLNVERLHITDESTFQTVISVTNPSELSKFSFTKNNLIDIKRFITTPSYNMGNLVNAIDNAKMPVDSGEVNSSVDIGGTTFTLQLSAYLHRELNLTRTANTSFAISPSDMVVGTPKLITGIETGFTTKLTVNSGATVNGGTADVEYNHPFQVELSCDSSGTNYISKLIYGSIV
jgi:hypothetical protein